MSTLQISADPRHLCPLVTLNLNESQFQFVYSQPIRSEAENLNPEPKSNKTGVGGPEAPVVQGHLYSLLRHHSTAGEVLGARSGVHDGQEYGQDAAQQ